MVLHQVVVTALYNVRQPLLSRMTRAVSTAFGSSKETASDVVRTTEVVLADKNTVVLPFGSNAVAFTWIGM